MRPTKLEAAAINLSRLFFTLDRFGQQADGNIAPGGMFFMFLRFQGLPM